MNPEPAKVERLVSIAERLIAALEADIAALTSGRPQDLRSTDPEIQRLTALYGREAGGLDVRTAKALAPQLRTRLLESTSQFREVLGRHARLVSRLRNASEGMIKAVAIEVDRRRAPTRTYSSRQQPSPRPASAMLYNGVV
jgi:hypothetical protein